MSLTNKIRRELSFKLAAMAVSKNVPAINAAVDELNAKFAETHAAYVETLLPEVPRSRWAELIQDGVLMPTGGLRLEVRHPVEREEGPCRYKTISLGYASAQYSPTHEDVRLLLAAMSNTRTSSLCLSHHGCSSMYVRFIPRYCKSLPQVASAMDINLFMLHPTQCHALSPAQRTRLEALAPLTEQAATITKGWLELVVSALQYREEVYALLCSCKTRKQLEDVFPEAAKLLAPVAPKRNEVVPAELAASVRRRLVEGVPS